MMPFLEQEGMLWTCSPIISIHAASTACVKSSQQLIGLEIVLYCHYTDGAAGY